MNARLLVLLSLLLLAGIAAYWRRSSKASPTAARELQAEQSARRFLRLRDAEAEADRTVWSATEPHVRVESALAARVEEASARRDWSAFAPTSGGLPVPDRTPLIWLRADLLSVRRLESDGVLESELRGEAVFRTETETPGKGSTRSLEWEATALWSDGTPPRLLSWRPRIRTWNEAARPSFEVWADLVIPTNGVGLFTDPLLVDAEGSETGLILGGAGVEARLEGGRWDWAPAGLGAPERVVAMAFGPVHTGGPSVLWVADGEGLRRRDGGVWKRVWNAPAKLRLPQSLTLGDMDGDGDIDVWLTQYRIPYVGGQFPSPYFDANDGNPSYLLRQDPGAFTDVTESAGLGAKRNRRTYSASWLDLDGDGDLDLVNVSDFAGVDLHRNEGGGRFRDITASLGDSRHLFGMSHAVMDLDGDVLPDVLATGMDSPVAAQLDAAGLGRPGFPDHTRLRSAMTFGNRAWVGRNAAGGYRMEPWPGTESLRRGGWAWGVAVLDWNNDGLDDVYLANGHETFPSRLDYERQFWTHDIHVGRSTNDPAALLYFTQAAEKRRETGRSYGGWQANRLFTGVRNGGAVDEGWIRGVALTEDCRNVVAGDFDRDGRVDLAVTTYEQWPVARQRLVILRNVSEGKGGWIGYRLPVHVPGSWIELETTAGVRRVWRVTGAGYRSQETEAVHFGLGTAKVLRAEWVWPGGKKVKLPVETARWHEMDGP